MNPHTLLAGLVLEDGRTWGEAATAWQLADATAIIEAVVLYHYLTRPRAGSKTTDLAAIVIVVLLALAPERARLYGVAVDESQGALLIDAIGGFVARTPGLAGALRVETKRVVVPASGATFEVLPADGASAFGLRPYMVVADEVAAWPDTPSARLLREAVLSSLAKRADARFVVLTSAGDPSSWAYRLLVQARTSVRWRANEIPGPVPWVSAEALEEQRALLTPSQYARLHQNVWTAPEDRLSSADDVRACVTHDDVLEPVVGHRYVAGVDLGLKKDSAVVAVCHAEREGDVVRVMVDRVDAFVPRKDRPVDLAVVEETVALVARRYNHARVMFDPHQAALMMQNLKRRGVRVEEYVFTQTSISRVAINMFRLLRDRRLGLPNDEALLDELAHVRLRETSPGVFRIDHDSDRHDDRAIAVGLAALQLAGESQHGPARTSARTMGHRVLPVVPIVGRGSVIVPRGRPRRGRSVQDLIGGYRPQHDDDPKGA